VARDELVRAVRERYLGVTGDEKSRGLAEFIANSGYHPQDAIEILNRTECGSKSAIDRLLREPKAAKGDKPRRRVVPEIRRRVTISTFADWHDPESGSREMDLVAHCGDVNCGSYVYSLVLTDIASGWTECTPLVVREKPLLSEALERVRVSLPFRPDSREACNRGLRDAPACANVSARSTCKTRISLRLSVSSAKKTPALIVKPMTLSV